MKPSLCIVALLLAACGGRDPSGSDGGNSGPNASAVCSIAVGDISIAVGPASTTATTLSCTATIDGHVLKCGPGAASVAKVSCSDGFGYVLSGGDAKLFIRAKYAASKWQVGAEFDGGSPLTGSVTLSHLPMPETTAPPAGSVQSAEIVFQGANGQNVVGNGTLTTTW